MSKKKGLNPAQAADLSAVKAAAVERHRTQAEALAHRHDPSPIRKAARPPRVTVEVPPELMERVKNAVYWTPGLTLGDVVAEGLELALKAREKAHGGPFAERSAPLRPGRKPK